MKLYRPDDEEDFDENSQSRSEPASLDRWIAEFPLSAVRKRRWKYLRPEGAAIVSPCTLAVREQLIAEAIRNGMNAVGTMTDVFVIGIGEPPQRSATKIGGLPYRPADLPWPQNEEGTAMLFAAQICFSESKDLVGDLPGDVMLIFVSDESGVEWHVEWHKLGIQNLVTDCPTSPQDLPQFFGMRYRVADYSEDDGIFESFRRGYLIGRVKGTKIGGLPMARHPVMPGRFLGSLGAVVATPEVLYPWFNQRRPISVEESIESENQLCFCDTKSFYIYLEDDGKVSYCIAED